MKRTKVTIVIPGQMPQTITVTETATGLYRCAIVDRYDRIEPFQGEDIGFGVVLFKSTIKDRISRIVVLNNWSQASYRAFNGKEYKVGITEVYHEC
jgi:hypothetical protein